MDDYKNIRLKISYKGTCYHGWQKQLGKNTIQETIENTFQSIFGQKINLIGSGRTDSGVHAFNQTANFKTDLSVNAFKIGQALNSKLPKDIRIKTSDEVDMGFHSRFNAIGKTYIYCIYNNRTANPLIDDYSYKVVYKLDIAAMQKAAEQFKGEHDFSGFTASGSSAKTTVRNIYDIRLMHHHHFLVLMVTGNGFLYKMVRNIAGTLIDVGRGRISADSIGEIILSQDRDAVGHTAKSQGLSLLDVYYDNIDMNAFLNTMNNEKSLDTIVSLL
ncbi:MAG: tRNA pseudouridine(38-40) synthase TruA [Dethiosulfatibacter sp.]|nr:tRNA pseudouridine(38-40) synthase TruA [Dethiosulfatibacter sp.]